MGGRTLVRIPRIAELLPNLPFLNQGAAHGAAQAR
jgi:hypothetical protein